MRSMSGCGHTVGVENDKRDDHEKRMPIELKWGKVLPSESSAEMQYPDEYLNND